MMIQSYSEKKDDEYLISEKQNFIALYSGMKNGKIFYFFIIKFMDELL